MAKLLFPSISSDDFFRTRVFVSACIGINFLSQPEARKNGPTSQESDECVLREQADLKAYVAPKNEEFSEAFLAIFLVQNRLDC